MTKLLCGCVLIFIATEQQQRRIEKQEIYMYTDIFCL